jgi:hypothetical protein
MREDQYYMTSDFLAMNNGLAIGQEFGTNKVGKCMTKESGEYMDIWMDLSE